MNYPVLDIFLTTMWIFLWILWFFLLFRVVGDLFRDRSVGGWAKAGWLVFLIVLPFLGVLVYLIARGKGMAERETLQAEAREQEFRSYVRDAAAGNGHGGAAGDQLVRLAELRADGSISEQEFQQAKDKVLSAA